jgi:hypothetical protein
MTLLGARFIKLLWPSTDNKKVWMAQLRFMSSHDISQAATSPYGNAMHSQGAAMPPETELTT